MSLDHPPARTAAEFGTVLQSELLKRGWMQRDLQAAMNNVRLPHTKPVGRHVVSNYIRGVCLPRALNLDLIAKALNVERFTLVQAPAPDREDEPEGEDSAAEDEIAELKMLPDGRAALRVDMDVPLETGMEIMRLLSAKAARA